jgi:hypothetical protein
MKILLFIALAGSCTLHAQDLIPATSEDIQEFDRQVTQHVKQDKATKPAKSNFGAQVSEEAKKLKGNDKDSDFGKWVSGQRRKSDEDRPSAQGSAGDNGQGNGHGNSGSPGNSNGKKIGHTK